MNEYEMNKFILNQKSLRPSKEGTSPRPSYEVTVRPSYEEIDSPSYDNNVI